MATSYEQLLNSLARSSAMATSANLQRYDQAMSIYDEIIKTYSPGGSFGKGVRGQLEKQKVRDVGAETQDLISSGLYGTSTQAATGRKWEESVGAPARLRLEDIQMQRLSQAQLDKAGFIERREDVGPDMSMLYGLAQQGGQYTSAPVDSGLGSNFGPAQPVPTSGPRTYGAPGGTPKTPPAPYSSTPTTTPTTSQGSTTTGQKMEWEEYYEGRAGIPTSNVPTSLKSMMGGGESEGNAPAHATGFQDTYNYASQLYKKTGQKLSQQAAYGQLYG